MTPKRFPARALAALTGIGLLAAGAFFVSGVQLLITNEVWRALYVLAGLELLIISVTPEPGAMLRATAASLATVVLLGRAAALIVTVIIHTGTGLGPYSPLAAAIGWVVIAAHTNALLVFWPALTATYIERP